MSGPALNVPVWASSDHQQKLDLCRVAADLARARSRRSIEKTTRVYWLQTGTEEHMNLYEVSIHGTESIYLLAPTKYRALELVGDYMADAGWSDMMQSGNIVVRQLDLSEEQILRPEKCRACSLNG